MPFPAFWGETLENSEAYKTSSKITKLNLYLLFIFQNYIKDTLKKSRELSDKTFRN